MSKIIINLLLNRYTITELLGNGAYSSVYLCKDTNNNLYALKVLFLI